MLALKTIYWCQIPRTVLVSNEKIEKKKSTHINQSKSAAVAAAANRKTKAACTLHTQMTLYKFTTHQMRCFFVGLRFMSCIKDDDSLKKTKKNTGDEACSHRHRWTKTLMKFIWELIIARMRALQSNWCDFQSWCTFIVSRMAFSCILSSVWKTTRALLSSQFSSSISH